MDQTTMQLKDILTIGISSLSLIIILISNIIEKRKENNRTIRKNLSDSLEAIIKIDVEMAKLRSPEIDQNSRYIVGLRRTYNSQRRIQVVNAEYLYNRHPEVATEADCVILAMSFKTNGDFQKAETFYQKSVDLSISQSVKHYNLRGYANFLFFIGKLELGRRKYREALELNLEDIDYNRRTLTDTYIMWSDTEREFNNGVEADRILEVAKSACGRIGNRVMREEMENQIEQRLSH